MLKYILFTIAFFMPQLAHAENFSISVNSFFDQSRNRTVPYKLYAPIDVSSPAPVVIFSHGLGGSIEAAPYLGKALAEKGYYAFFIQHAGSDKSVWKKSGVRNAKSELMKSIKDPNAASDRYNDIPFVLDQLAILNAQNSTLKGKLDLNKIGMAGHSYGARSVMMAAGETFGRSQKSYKDVRIKAAVALSPNVPMWAEKRGVKNLSKLYKNVDIPLFHMTGTKDGSPLAKTGSFDPSTRTLPYKNIQAPDQYLLILDGAEHSDFGGRQNTQMSRVHEAVSKGAVLFFDAYLRDKSEAQSYLKNNYKTLLNSKDHFEYK